MGCAISAITYHVGKVINANGTRSWLRNSERRGRLMGIITTLARLFIFIYGGFKFATADEEYRTPTWYGIWVLIALFCAIY